MDTLKQVLRCITSSDGMAFRFALVVNTMKQAYMKDELWQNEVGKKLSAKEIERALPVAHVFMKEFCLRRRLREPIAFQPHRLHKEKKRCNL